MADTESTTLRYDALLVSNDQPAPSLCLLFDLYPHVPEICSSQTPPVATLPVQLSLVSSLFVAV